MKKILSVFFTLLSLLLVMSFMSCGEKPDSIEDDKNLNQNDNFESGWWKESIEIQTNSFENTYYLFDDKKEIQRVGFDDYECDEAILQNYKKNTSFEYLYNYAKNSKKTKFIKIDEKDLPEWAQNKTDNDNDLPESGIQRKYSYISIPSIAAANVNETTTINYSGYCALYTDDEYEVIIIKNDNNINIIANAYLGYFEIKGESEGTVTIKICDKTVNCESNECDINFIEETKPELDTSTSLLVGNWTLKTQNLLYDIIEFYTDGTGKVYHTQYEGYNTFTWKIIDSDTFEMTNMLGQKGIVTYNVSATTLYLTNFFAYKEQIEAYRQ